MHNHQKKFAWINYFTGFGRCSIAVELPVISTLKVQCCPIPTAILSNHTQFPSYYFHDLTACMSPYIEQWKGMDLRFNGICSGFLGSKEQIQFVIDFISEFKKEDTIVIIDPVMADRGCKYQTYTDEMCDEMKRLVQYADILTPNLTEACILTNTPYNPKMSNKKLHELAKQLSDQGPDKIVITGIERGKYVANYCFEKGKEDFVVKTVLVGTQRSGTGDLFTSIISADAINQIPFEASVRKASKFIKLCILKAIEMDIPMFDGVPFEECLHKLR